jgi:hypothetical protein
VQETVQTTAERAADLLEETAGQIREHAPGNDRHFPWRPLLVTVGVATAALGVAGALRKMRARGDADGGRFPADMPTDVSADEAQAKIDRSVASAKSAVTDITDHTRSEAADAG